MEKQFRNVKSFFGKVTGWAFIASLNLGACAQQRGEKLDTYFKEKVKKREPQWGLPIC